MVTTYVTKHGDWLAKIAAKTGDPVPYGTEEDYNKIKAYLLNRFPGLVEADRLACYDIEMSATPSGS